MHCLSSHNMIYFYIVSNIIIIPCIPALGSRTDHKEVKPMRKYEITYIIRPNVDDEQKKAVNERFANILTSNGAEIIESKEWGKRRLAYEINEYREGIYHIVTLTSGSEAINEFDRLAKISEDIVRHMTVRLDEDN